MARIPVSRRRFLLSATGAMLGASQIRGRAGASNKVAGFPLSEVSDDVTTNKLMLSQPLFQQRTEPVPWIDPAVWTLRIGGLVRQPFMLTLNELLNQPSVEIPCSIACATHSPDNQLIGHAVWKGVSAKKVLDQAEVQPEARFAQMYAADGYRTFLSIDQFKDAVLAYSMNGEMLRSEFGYPVWMIVPGLYSYKMPRWVEQINFTATALTGTWEDKGWSAVGAVQTTSAITSPHHLQNIRGNLAMSGFAYAGDREIVQVEVSVDDGLWRPVPFRSRGRNSLVDWQIDWMPPAPGDYLLKVRATDSAGFTQHETEGNVFPEGTSAVHQVVVRVLSIGRGV